MCPYLCPSISELKIIGRPANKQRSDVVPPGRAFAGGFKVGGKRTLDVVHRLREIDPEVDCLNALDGEALFDDALGDLNDAKEALVLLDALREKDDVVSALDRGELQPISLVLPPAFPQKERAVFMHRGVCPFVTNAVRGIVKEGEIYMISL